MDKKIEKTCQICSKSFMIYKNRTGTYCSLECTHKGLSKRFSGNNSSSYKGSDRSKTVLSLLAKKYYDDKCAICGWEEGSCDTHHIIPVKEDGKNLMSNVIILCPNHHRLVHENKIKREELKHISILLYSENEYYNI